MARNNKMYDNKATVGYSGPETFSEADSFSN